MTTPKRATAPAAAAPVAEAEIAAEVADGLLEQFAAGASSAAEIAAAYSVATNVIAEAYARDLDCAKRADHARHWRGQLSAITGRSR